MFDTLKKLPVSLQIAVGAVAGLAVLALVAKTIGVRKVAEGAAGGLVGGALDIVGGAASGALGAVSNPNNAVYEFYNGAWRAVGVIDENQSIGTAIYDWLHPEWLTGAK
jgi:hypothetical protein